MARVAGRAQILVVLAALVLARQIGLVRVLMTQDTLELGIVAGIHVTIRTIVPGLGVPAGIDREEGVVIEGGSEPLRGVVTPRTVGPEAGTGVHRPCRGGVFGLVAGEAIRRPEEACAGAVVALYVAWWHAKQSVGVPGYVPLVWQDTQLVERCAPVKGNAVVSWLNVAGCHAAVEWHDTQSVEMPEDACAGAVVAL